MDEWNEDRLWGAITAQEALLHTVLELMLRRTDAPIAAARKVRDKMLADFDIPNPATPKTDEHFRTSQHAQAHLEKFWGYMEKALALGPSGETSANDAPGR